MSNLKNQRKLIRDESFAFHWNESFDDPFDVNPILVLS